MYFLRSNKHKLEQLAKDNKKISDFHIRSGSPLAYRLTGAIIMEKDTPVTAQDLKDLFLKNYFFEADKIGKIYFLNNQKSSTQFEKSHENKVLVFQEQRIFRKYSFYVKYILIII